MSSPSTFLFDTGTTTVEHEVQISGFDADSHITAHRQGSWGRVHRDVIDTNNHNIQKGIGRVISQFLHDNKEVTIITNLVEGSSNSTVVISSTTLYILRTGLPRSLTPW